MLQICLHDLASDPLMKEWGFRITPGYQTLVAVGQKRVNINLRNYIHVYIQVDAKWWLEGYRMYQDIIKSGHWGWKCGKWKLVGKKCGKCMYWEGGGGGERGTNGKVEIGEIFMESRNLGCTTNKCCLPGLFAITFAWIVCAFVHLKYGKQSAWTLEH